MTDVLVRRCTIRIVRHGGWSWGPRPRALVDEALRALPDLIAAQLEEAAANWSTSTVTVEAPVRVAARVRLAELADGTARTIDASLAAPLRHALHDAIAAAPTVAFSTAVADADAAAPQELGALAGAVPASAEVEPLALPLEWAARGALASLLELLPRRALEGLLAGGAKAEAATDAEAPAAELVEALLRGAALRPGADGAVALRTLLAAVVELRTRTATPTRELLRAARAVAAAEGLEPAAPRAQAPRHVAAVAPATPSAGAAPAHRAQRSLGREPVRDADAPLPTRVAGRALPFLLLRPLSRLGYLEALGSALEPARAAAFAAALAWKVLDPPGRGWRRTPTDELTAAAFAGTAARVPEEPVTGLARTTDVFAPLLAAVVFDAVVRGRRAGGELAVVGANGTLYALDPDGCFVVASAGDADELAPALRLAGPRTAYVDDPAVRRVLRALGIRTRALRHHPTLNVDRVEACAAAFAERFGAVRAESPGLERAVELAAWTALGTVAWQLWREREPTDPLLALERFGDLEARVRFESRRLSVTLPLGRRSLDLQEHDLLGSVLDVPWLPHRTVDLGPG